MLKFSILVIQVSISIEMQTKYNLFTNTNMQLKNKNGSGMKETIWMRRLPVIERLRIGLGKESYRS